MQNLAAGEEEFCRSVEAAQWEARTVWKLPGKNQSWSLCTFSSWCVQSSCVLLDRHEYELPCILLGSLFYSSVLSISWWPQWDVNKVRFKSAFVAMLQRMWLFCRSGTTELNYRIGVIRICWKGYAKKEQNLRIFSAHSAKNASRSTFMTVILSYRLQSALIPMTNSMPHALAY